MTQQMTLDFEPAMPERFPTLREYIAHRSAVVAKPQKSQAADMDIAPSMLTRKLHPHDGDTQRFNLDDLESWLKSTGDAANVIAYLAAKYMDSDEARRLRAVARLESLIPDIAAVLNSVKGDATLTKLRVA